MVVITAICVIAQADVVRYRPLLLALAAGKAASSLTALIFYLFDDDVFIYLLNFIVDGSLVCVSLLLWSLAGRVGRPRHPPEGARRGCGPPSSAPCERSRRRPPPVLTGCPRPSARCRSPSRSRRFLSSAAAPAPCGASGSGCGCSSGCRFRGASPGRASRPARSTWRRWRPRASRSTATCCCSLKVLADARLGTITGSARRRLRARCAVREGEPAAAARRLVTSAARRRRGLRRRDRRLRAPAAPPRPRPSPRPASTSSCSRPDPTSTATYPDEPLERSPRSTATAA